MKNMTRRIVFIGLLVSISIILTRMLSFMVLGIARVSFGDIPIMLSGILFGPVTGAVTGALSDLTGVLLFPSPGGASFLPGMTLSKALVGLIPALAIRYLKGSEFTKVMFGVAAAEIICSMVLDTIWLSPFYGKGIIGLMAIRVPIRAVLMAAEIPVIYQIMKRLKKVVHIN